MAVDDLDKCLRSGDCRFAHGRPPGSVIKAIGHSNLSKSQFPVKCEAVGN
jgi:hypothetical protein